VLTSEVKAAPHLPQKFEDGAFSTPHFGQRRASAFPQRAQKLFPAGFSEPHFEQGIACPPPLRQSEDRPYSQLYASQPVIGGAPATGKGGLSEMALATLEMP
jgi:hypothetical protein